MLKSVAALIVLIVLSGCDLIFKLSDPTTAIDASVDAPPPRPLCSTTNMLGEDFDGTNPWSWQGETTLTTLDNTVVQMNSAIEMTLNFDGTVAAAIGPYMDLRDNELTVEVDRTNPAGDMQLVLISESFPQNELRIASNGTQLKFTHGPANGPGNTADERTYDPVMHRFWRIARTGDQVTWETASVPEGPFIVHARFSQAPWATFMRPLFFARKADGSVASYMARMFNVNGGSGTVTSTACAAHTLIDDFNGDSFDPQWARGRRSAGTVYEERAGSFVAGLPVNGGGEAALVSSTIYDLRGSHVSVAVAQAPLGPGKITYLLLRSLDFTEFLMFRVDNDRLEAIFNGTLVFGDTYLPDVHKFWRVRAEGVDLFWETSVDGVEFVEFSSRLNMTKPVDRLTVELGIRGNGTTTDNEARFDRIN